MERIIEPKENDSTALPPFLAYGKNGEVKVSLSHFAPGSLKILVENLLKFLKHFVSSPITTKKPWFRFLTDHFLMPQRLL